MKFTRNDVVFHEHPWHISLLFSISGCPNQCSGCHSPELRENKGLELTNDLFLKIINQYSGLVSNIIFFGGDHEEDELCSLLSIAKAEGFMTTLWSGCNKVSDRLLQMLDYVKVGEYDEKLGPLGSPTTNQRYYECRTGIEIQIKTGA